MDTHHTIKYRNFKIFDETKFQKDISEAPWNILEISDDPNERLDLFEQLFLKIVDDHAPFVERRVKVLQQPQWWTDDIQSAIENRFYLFKLFSKDKLDSAAKVLYQRARKDVSYMIRQPKNSSILRF